MDAPASFLLLSLFLGLAFGLCMLTGAVWFYFGWRKRVRGLQWFSLVPLGVGLFIVGPLLLLSLGLVMLWFVASWLAPDERAVPAQSPPTAQ